MGRYRVLAALGHQTQRCRWCLIRTSDAFNLGPYTSNGKSVAEVRAELKPFVIELDKGNITYSYNVTSLPGFLEHFTTYLGPLPYGQYSTGEVLGSRLTPPEPRHKRQRRPHIHPPQHHPSRLPH